MRVQSDVYLPQGTGAGGSGLLLLACTFPPGIAVLSQGAAGVATGSGNLFGHAVMGAGTLLSALINQRCRAASPTPRIRRDPASVGPGAPEQHRHPEMDRAVLPVLPAVFCFLGDPLKARREGRSAGENLCIHCRSKSGVNCSLQAALHTKTGPGWSWCKPQGREFWLPMSLPREHL